MKTKRNLLAAVIIAGVCFATARLATSIPSRSYDSQRGGGAYRVDAMVTTPEYRTDADRVIDAYERLMERYIDLAEGQPVQAGADCQGIVQKLDSLDVKLDKLSARLERIEKAMGIDPNAVPVSVVHAAETRGAAKITFNKKVQP